MPAGPGAALVAHLASLERRTSQPASVAGLASPKLRRVLDYVASLDAPLTLRRLADVAEMDLFRFVRAFKQSTGVLPHRFVLEARISRAKELLGDRSLSITEIALRTGFATPSHFSVTFRRITDAAPRAYRDALPVADEETGRCVRGALAGNVVSVPGAAPGRRWEMPYAPGPATR